MKHPQSVVGVSLVLEQPPLGELNTRGVAEYSDFGPIERYISETVQDRSYVCINH